MENSGSQDVCARCGHDRQIPVGAATRLVLKLRRRSVRVTCGQPTEAGWTCPCRSRFHAV